MPPPLNLHADNGTVFIAGGRVANAPAPGATDHYFPGYTIQPGLVNAHDHLELNHYPRTKFREVYTNAHMWGADVDKRLKAGLYRNLRAHSLWDRCFIGGLKNLLAGVTTVAQHGPLYRPLRRRAFPVNVLHHYGWAHSLHFDTPERVKASYDATPPDAPWFIHLAEGTDEIAAGEYRRLKALGCVGPNTVIVHGVGLTDDDMADAAPRVRGLVCCPTTNHYLLGRTVNAPAWVRAGGRLALGTDSRLTADGDMCAERAHLVDEHAITLAAAAILGLDDVGSLEPGARADLTLDRPPERRNQHLVMVGGIPMIGSPALMTHFKQFPTIAVTLDGSPKRMNAQLARQAQRCKLAEPGLVLDEPVWRRFWY